MRIYGKVLETWEAYDWELGCHVPVQYEFSYKDYDMDGRLIGSGSEDFSPARKRMAMSERWVWTWDGKKRNRGGYRAFECQGLIKYRDSDRKDIKEFLKNKYGCELVELR